MYNSICRRVFGLGRSLMMSGSAAGLACVAGSVVGTSRVEAQPLVPGYVVEQFGTVPAGYRPFTMSRDAAGWLYFGSDDNNAAGIQLVRLGTGGGAAVPFGLSPIYDPDGVLIDTTGQISGSQGALLVMSSSFAGGEGVLRKVLQNGEVSIVAGPLGILNNGDAMAFDSLNRLYMNVSPNHTIVRFVGGVPTVFAQTPTNLDTGVIAIDDQDRVMVAFTDGAVRRYTTVGVLDTTVQIGSGPITVAWAGGPPWGPATYAMDAQAGQLKRIAANGTTQTVGTNFGVVFGLLFSADGDMYATNYDTGIVYRVRCAPSASVTGAMQSMCPHGTAEISVLATGGTPFTYQWRKDGEPINVVGNPSAGTAMLTLTNVGASDEGAYDCIVTNGCGTDTSDAVQFRVCAANFNCDSTVDFFDYLDFVSEFASNAVSADFNADGVVDFFDYLDFVQAFSIGC